MSAPVSAQGSKLAPHWTLDPGVTFLNHGSFGACPQPVLEYQQELRERSEREPVDFYAREWERRHDEAREALAAFLGAQPADLVPVLNATQGVNAVLRSYPFEAGDELIVTDHEYNACRNVLEFVAARAGAKVVVAAVAFPLASPDQVVGAVLDRVTARTRLALLDHVTSQTGLVFPVEQLVPALEERGVDTLVDAAHAPGMLALDLEALGAAWYTGNCHKWLCAPKASGFLVTRRDKQAQTRPVAISHGANSPRRDRSRYQIEFGWTGTDDPTPFLAVPEAIRFLGSLLPGGWPAVRDHNRELALEARRILCAALGVAPPAPDEMIGSLAAVELPDGDGNAPVSPLDMDPLQDALRNQHAIEVPVIAWPAPPKRLLRISAQLYNDRAQYERLAAALGLCLGSRAGGE